MASADASSMTRPVSRLCSDNEQSRSSPSRTENSTTPIKNLSGPMQLDEGEICNQFDNKNDGFVLVSQQQHVESIQSKTTPPAERSSARIRSRVEKRKDFHREGEILDDENKVEFTDVENRDMSSHSEDAGPTEKTVSALSSEYIINNGQSNDGQSQDISANEAEYPAESSSENDDLPKRKRQRRRRRSHTVEEEQLITVNHFTDKDVLMGRGNHVNKLPGNLRFRRIVHPYRMAYNNTKSASEKRRILYEAYDSIVRGGNRFLEVVQWRSSNQQEEEQGKKNSPSGGASSDVDAYHTDGRGVFRTVVLSRAVEKVAQALREPKWVPPPPETEHDEEVNATSMKTIIQSKEKQEQESTEKQVHAIAAKQVPESKEKKSPQDGNRNTMPQIKHVLLLSSQNEEHEGSSLKKENEGAPPVVVQQNLKTTKPSRSKAKKAKTKVAASIKTKAKTKPESRALKSNALANQMNDAVDFSELSDKDVMFGRGHYVNKHSGNVRFRKVIMDHKAAYAKLPLAAKRPMALEIFNKFEGRFWEAMPVLNPSSDQSSPVFHRVALDRCLEKICQALREKYTYIGKPNLWSNNEMSQSREKKTKSVKFEEVEEKRELSHNAVSADKPVKQADESKIAVGSRIAVYWPIDETYYEAVVEDCRVTRKDSPNNSSSEQGDELPLYNIRYLLDNEREWIDLNLHKYKTLDDDEETEVVPHTQENNKHQPERQTNEETRLKQEKANRNQQQKEKQKHQRQQQLDGQVVRIMRSGNTKRHCARRTLFWMRD
ncbi:hypothetical protein ACA910_010807 [Epithemia clementina (nom. ined.)]